MPLSIVNWNILYEIDRPLDKDRFINSAGKPSLIEKKALTAALAFFCYTDNTTPSHPDDPVAPQDRQEADQLIKGKVYRYYRGGSNAHVRMEQVKQNIQTLAGRANIVCLQEVTLKMAGELEKIFQVTHRVFYSLKPGNNHGVMMLVQRELKPVSECTELRIKSQDGIERSVILMDVRDPETRAVVRVAVAHLFGHHGTAQAVDQEARDLFERLNEIPQLCDAIVLCADVNETKWARDKVKTPAVVYAKTTGVGGWQLNLLNNPGSGQIPVQSKPESFGLCAIMVDVPRPSEALDLSDLPEGLSDHAPIGTKIRVEAEVTKGAASPEPVAQPKPAAPSIPTPVAAPATPPVAPTPAAPAPAPAPNAAPNAPVASVSWFQQFFNICTQMWDHLKAGFWSIWQGFVSIFS